MNRHHPIVELALREWLLTGALAALAACSLHLGRAPHLTRADLLPLGLLLALFIAVRGLERSGLLYRIGQHLEQGGWLSVKLVSATFLLSMVVTIDVSLVIMIPLALKLDIREREPLAILVALSAHLGAAFTPFGTPQNLFIFSHYGLNPAEFLRTIAPFSFGLLGLLVTIALRLRTHSQGSPTRDIPPLRPGRALVYSLLLGWVVLCVLRLLPPWLALAVLAYPLCCDRPGLKVDYGLLATFLCFIGLAEEMRQVLATDLRDATEHIFVLSAITSQFISNVPTTLLLSPFTDQWRALLWGTNVGGFGSLMAAMANLITYRLYVTHCEDSGWGGAGFVLRFVLAGYLMFFAGIGLYELMGIS